MSRSRKWLMPAVLVLLVAITAVLLLSLYMGMAGGRETALQVLFDAQWDYHSEDADGDGYLEFATDVSMLDTGIEPAGGYSYKVYPVPGEQFAPDGGLLSGFIIAAEPADRSGTVYLVDQIGETFQVPVSLLPEWLEQYSPTGGDGGN